MKMITDKLLLTSEEKTPPRGSTPLVGQHILHFEILSKLGEGGMGVVYKAKDTRLGRIVALKSISSNAGSVEADQEQLSREACAAAALNHPNVCTIYGIHFIESRLFIEMEFIEGETLRKIIDTDSLPVDAVIRYGISICEAMHAAHSKGIIHRDIKSENINITTSGSVKVMDFGLATIHAEESGKREVGLSGTLAYMAPEVIQGHQGNARSDIFSFGVVLYEMLTGNLPFRGYYESALMYSIMNEPPLPIEDIRPEAPVALRQIILRALEKNPSKRYQTAENLIADFSALTPQAQRASKQNEVKTIAVLPFSIISPEKDADYLSDGLTEEIISDLSQVQTMRVISRTSVMRLKGVHKDMKSICRELDVRYILEGSVRKQGSNVRITAQLIDGTNETHLWAEKFSGLMEDLFDMQEKVSRAIVQALKVTLTPQEEASIASRPFTNMQAYEYYLRARQEIFRWTNESHDRALQYLEEGLKIVGDNPHIHAGIGYMYWQFVNTGRKGSDYLDKAEQCVRKIFNMEPESPLGHRLQGYIEAFRGNQQKSVQHIRKALDTNPNDPDALRFLVLIEAAVGKDAEAYAHATFLLQVDPLVSANFFMMGFVHLTAGRFEQALDMMRKNYEFDKTNPVHRFYYADMFAMFGKDAEAITLIDQAYADNPDHLYAQFGLVLKYVLTGEKEKALSAITPSILLKTQIDWMDSWTLAKYYARLGENENAIRYMELAVDHGFLNYPFIAHLDPFLESIRKEPRFQQLLHRLKILSDAFHI